MCSVNVEPFRGHVYRGIIKEDAVEGDNVDLDSPLYVRNRNGLARGKYLRYCVLWHSNIYDEVPLTFRGPPNVQGQKDEIASL